jgi:repressor LexA
VEKIVMPSIQKTLRIYEFIKSEIALKGQAPTIREMCAEFGLRSSASVDYHLTRMEERGWIKRCAAWRGIRITKPEYKKAA